MWFKANILDRDIVHEVAWVNFTITDIRPHAIYNLNQHVVFN